jgi:hypothetical protein
LIDVFKEQNPAQVWVTVTLSKNEKNVEKSASKRVANDAVVKCNTMEMSVVDNRTIGTAGREKNSNFCNKLQVPCNPDARTGRKKQNMCPSTLRLKKTSEDTSKIAK